MIFHSSAPDWTPTGDIACTVPGIHGVIATVYQPAPRNGKGWTPKEEQRFQRFVKQVQRGAEQWNGLPPRATTIRWFIPPPEPCTIATGQQSTKGARRMDLRSGIKWGQWILFLGMARTASWGHWPQFWGIIALSMTLAIVSHYLPVTAPATPDPNAPPVDTGRPLWMQKD